MLVVHDMAVWFNSGFFFGKNMWFGSVRFGSVRFGSVRIGSVRFGKSPVWSTTSKREKPQRARTHVASLSKVFFSLFLSLSLSFSLSKFLYRFYCSPPFVKPKYRRPCCRHIFSHEWKKPDLFPVTHPPTLGLAKINSRNRRRTMFVFLEGGSRDFRELEMK
jgi:hypothetical protein